MPGADGEHPAVSLARFFARPGHFYHSPSSLVKMESMSEFEDRMLACRECGASFVFTAREQEFYQARGFGHEPSRCPECRSARKTGRRGPRETSEIVCAACGTITEVPFRPAGSKPVYCRDCYSARS